MYQIKKILFELLLYWSRNFFSFLYTDFLQESSSESDDESGVFVPKAEALSPSKQYSSFISEFSPTLDLSAASLKSPKAQSSPPREESSPPMSPLIRKISLFPAVVSFPKHDYSKHIHLTISRNFNSPLSNVFTTWIQQFDHWYAVPGSTKGMQEHQLDSAFYFETFTEGQLIPHYARFVRFEPDNYIELRWMSRVTKGEETVVSLELHPAPLGYSIAAGSVTQLVLVHAGFPDDTAMKKQQQIWSQAFSQLEHLMTIKS